MGVEQFGEKTEESLDLRHLNLESQIRSKRLL